MKQFVMQRLPKNDKTIIVKFTRWVHFTLLIYSEVSTTQQLPSALLTYVQQLIVHG
jgi:hypothetical protein